LSAGLQIEASSEFLLASTYSYYTVAALTIHKLLYNLI